MVTANQDVVKIKLDENLPIELTEDLRRLGHDAHTVGEENPGGTPDPQVLEAAKVERRVLFTLDKGIANLQRYPPDRFAGVVLFRTDSSGRGAVISSIRERLPLVLKLEFAERLTVVGPSRIRIR